MIFRFVRSSNIFETSLEVFGKLRLSSEKFENDQKRSYGLPTTIGESSEIFGLENAQKQKVDRTEKSCSKYENLPSILRTVCAPPLPPPSRSKTRRRLSIIFMLFTKRTSLNTFILLIYMYKKQLKSDSVTWRNSSMVFVL